MNILLIVLGAIAMIEGVVIYFMFTGNKDNNLDEKIKELDEKVKEYDEKIINSSNTIINEIEKVELILLKNDGVKNEEINNIINDIADGLVK